MMKAASSGRRSAPEGRPQVAVLHRWPRSLPSQGRSILGSLARDDLRIRSRSVTAMASVSWPPAGQIRMAVDSRQCASPCQCTTLCQPPLAQRPHSAPGRARQSLDALPGGISLGAHREGRVRLASASVNSGCGVTSLSRNAQGDARWLANWHPDCVLASRGLAVLSGRARWFFRAGTAEISAGRGDPSTGRVGLAAGHTA